MQPCFVLVQPQMGENIGASARAMWNFGLDRLRLVSPRDGWPNASATAVASGAGRLLDEALVVDTTAQAIANTTFVFATTARHRALTKIVYSPERAMLESRKRLSAGEDIAILFGPERSGLDNACIARANAVISVPVNSESPSLNLSQCVLLIAYEWYRHGIIGVDRLETMPKSEWATHQEVESLAAHYEQQLTTAGFFFPPEKSNRMKQNLRNLWSRIPLTRAETQMLHGVLRQMARERNKDSQA